MKKRYLVCTILLLIIFSLFALGSAESSVDDQGNGAVAGNAEKGNLGHYSVTIDSCRLAEDWEGNPVVIVQYTFKNVSSDDATAFYIAVSDAVYQDGVGLNREFMVDDSANYKSDNQEKAIKKGASIVVELAYELNNTTSDIEVEVEEWISLNDTVVTKTFKISD